MYTILPLAFSQKFEIKEDVLLQAIDWAVGVGAKGIVATGSVGEFSPSPRPSARRSWRSAWARSASTRGSSRGHDRLGGHLGDHPLDQAGPGHGLDYALIVPPYYWKVGDNEVFRHYQMITRPPAFR